MTASSSRETNGGVVKRLVQTITTTRQHEERDKETETNGINGMGRNGEYFQVWFGSPGECRMGKERKWVWERDRQKK